jgi:hypothetical protein
VRKSDVVLEAQIQASPSIFPSFKADLSTHGVRLRLVTLNVRFSPVPTSSMSSTGLFGRPTSRWQVSTCSTGVYLTILCVSQLTVGTSGTSWGAIPFPGVYCAFLYYIKGIVSQYTFSVVRLWRSRHRGSRRHGQVLRTQAPGPLPSSFARFLQDRLRWQQLRWLC